MVESEFERLLRCPSCGSDEVHVLVRESGLSAPLDIFGFGAMGTANAPKDVRCADCGHRWVRPSMSALQELADRNLARRFEELEARAEQLRRELPRRPDAGRARPAEPRPPSPDGRH
ncbi:MAG: hypothetical protein ACXVYY_13960 [Oryzihumus sp.]